MKKTTQRLAMLLTVLLLCLSATTGCSTQGGADTAAPKDNEAATATVAPSEVPEPDADAKKTIEVAYLVAESYSVDYPYSVTDLPCLKKIHDKALSEYGIDFKLETAIGSEFESVVNTRFASGGTLPDVVNYRYDDLKLADLYKNGLILALNDYPESIPNYMKYVNADPYLLVANGNQEGKLLRFTEYFNNISHISLGLCVRKDWLDKLGKKLPTTTDELEADIKAFQDSDVNGNGKKDEMLAFTDWIAMNSVLSTAFGVQQMQGAMTSWYYDENGKIYNTMLTVEAKNYVTWIHKLYSEGLIWDAFLTYTQDDWSAFKLADRLAGNCGRNWDGVLVPTDLAGNGIKCEYVPVLPITDGSHEKSILLTNYGGDWGIMLTKDCDDPARVASFFDYFYTVEGHQLRYYGEVAPGGDYYVRDTTQYESIGVTTPESLMVPTDKYNEESKQVPDMRAKLGINAPLFLSAVVNTPQECVAEYYFTFTPEICGDAARMEYMAPVYQWMQDNGHKEAAFVNANSDQAKAISDHADLFTYMDEQIKAFMTGARPLDEWDGFVAKCNEMGMADVVAVQQQRYDAYKAIFK